MFVLIALQAATTVGDFDLGKVEARASASAATGCGSSDNDAIVVCGSRRGDERYRVPPSDAGAQPGARHRGDAPSAMLGITPFAPCGIFEGQRRCSKKEMEAYGYGQGRDPITIAGKLIGAIIDPD